MLTVISTDGSERFTTRAVEILTDNLSLASYPFPLRRPLMRARGGLNTSGFGLNVALKQGELDEYIEIRKSEIVGASIYHSFSAMTAIDFAPGATDLDEIFQILLDSIPRPRQVVVGPSQLDLERILAYEGWQEWASTASGISLMTDTLEHFGRASEVEEVEEVEEEEEEVETEVETPRVTYSQAMWSAADYQNSSQISDLILDIRPGVNGSTFDGPEEE